jgi:hypothetical protein
MICRLRYACHDPCILIVSFAAETFYLLVFRLSIFCFFYRNKTGLWSWDFSLIGGWFNGENQR